MNAPHTRQDSLPIPQQGDPEVTLELGREHGMTEEEYQWMLDELGRTPTLTELGIYSVMWSEHCSYKNSIAVIKTMPRDGGALLVSAGEENAGLVDIGDGLAAAFKIESHNHPSAVEPYQGAATGVGGIQRDIFTMGARPIASLNSLRFGPLDSPRVRFLLDGVVRGIGDYGNSFGVPTVGGEVYFDASYEGNPLVNAMSVGLVRVEDTASATAEGVGNPVLIVGSATGRDGIHGATFASVELSEESDAMRPNVQVGDPFTEKLLLEATLEALRTGAVVGIQDMGAAGITCSSSEMSARGESGMVLDLEHVPVREDGMTPYEIMLSESQERMLIVAQKGREHEVEEVFKKWDLHVARIGQVTGDGRVKVFWHGELVADVPADHLVLGGGAPVYHREATRPTYLDETLAFTLDALPDLDPEGAEHALIDLLGTPNIASKRWIFQQYDTTVRTNTVLGPGPTDAAVVRIKGSEKGLAMTTDCNARHVYLNPRRGGQAAVAEAARNVVCAGGRPLAVTNCLNFGNPYKPEVYWTFREAVGGLGDACRAFGTPVTGGNVSFYNESPEAAVFPTPTIGMLGLVEDVERDTTAVPFRDEGDAVFLLAPQEWAHRDDLGGSEYLTRKLDRPAGDAPHLDLAEELAVQQAMLSMIQTGIVKSAHDVSDGGLAVCLAEKALHDQVGADIDLGTPGVRLDALLFGEAHSRIVFTASAADEGRLRGIVAGQPVRLERIGTVGGQNLSLSVDGRRIIDVPAETLQEAFEGTIPRMMQAS